jgi:hypothetical protein
MFQGRKTIQSSGETTNGEEAQGIEAEIPEALPQVKLRNWSG